MSLRKPKRALMYLYITVVACLCTSRPVFAANATTDPYFCLHPELCVVSTPLSPLEYAVFDVYGLGDVAVRTSEKRPVYFIKVVPVEAGKKAKAHWFDLLQVMRRQPDLANIHTAASGRYALDETGNARYRLIEYDEAANPQKVLYHLVRIEDRNFWVIVTSVDSDKLPQYNTEIISLLKSARLGKPGGLSE